MSSDLAISVRGVGKTFQVATTQHRPTTLGELLMQKLKNPFGSSQPTHQFEALEDVSFEVKRGEVLGIVGRNGAGKSTLLKILSRITPPTRGEIDIYGRVGALLEVGTGFHPELTGRENIYLNGTILGMRKTEIQKRFDEIVAFSEVEEFLDTPVKRYSSGMYVRLAFAVAAHLEPEILIVDEVLAVGDASFQKKCLGKMGDASRNEGRTVLFVSHNMAAMRALCSRAILMDAGRMMIDGDVSAVTKSYLKNEKSAPAMFTWEDQEAPSHGGFAFRRVSILNGLGESSATVSHDESFTVCIEYEMDSAAAGIRVGFLIQNSEGIDICGSNDVHASGSQSRGANRYVSRCRFPGYLLNEGRYQLQFGADALHGKIYIRTPFCLSFSVEDTERHSDSRHLLPGVLRPLLEWGIEPRN